ncbi:MAG: hypothetical protein AAFR66_20065 [Bacteroidota bacterium]
MYQVKTSLIFFLVFKASLSISQTKFNTEEKDSSNVYFYSIIKYCELVDSGRLKKQDIYVEKDYLLTDGLPNQINSLTIKYLDKSQIRKFVRKNTQITILKIFPLAVKEEEFSVFIVPFSVTYKKRKLNYINAGNFQASFRYDQTSMGLVFSHTKMNGI